MKTQNSFQIYLKSTTDLKKDGFQKSQQRRNFMKLGRIFFLGIVLLIHSCSEIKKTNPLTVLALLGLGGGSSSTAGSAVNTATPVVANAPNCADAVDALGNPVTIEGCDRTISAPQPSILPGYLTPPAPGTVPACTVDDPCQVDLGMPAVNANRYTPITFQFRQSMDLSSICTGANNLAFSAGGSVKSGNLNTAAIAITAGGPALAATCRWGSFRTLFVTMTSTLPSLTTVTATVTNQALTFGGTPLTFMNTSWSPSTSIPFTQNFVTEMDVSQLTYTIVRGVNSWNLGINGGLIIHESNMGAPTTLTARANFSPSVSDPTQISDFQLFRLGNVDGAGNINNGIDVCPGAGNCTSGELNTLSTVGYNLTGANAPSAGGNMYFYRITLAGTPSRVYFRSFGFQWGFAQPNPDVVDASSGRLTMENSSAGLAQIGTLLGSFASSSANRVLGSGNFTIDNKSFNWYMQNPTATGPVNGTFDGQTCTTAGYSWVNAGSITYITNLGPYCNISVALPFWSQGWIDVYIKSIQIEESSTIANNVTASLTPLASRMDLTMNGKLLRGDLRIFVRGCGGIACVTNPTGSVYDVEFIMNPTAACDINDTSCFYDLGKPYRVTTAQSSLTVDSSGLLDIALLNPFASSKNNAQFNVQQWSDNIVAFNKRNVYETSWLAALVNAILNSAIPNNIWKIVQGVLRSTYQTVAPNVLNAVFKQLRLDASNNGINLDLPDFLPAPFNNSRLNVGANLRSSGGSNISFVATASGIEAGLDVGIIACQKDAFGRCQYDAGYSFSGTLPPAVLTGGVATNSFTRSQSNVLPPTQTGRIAAGNGVLLAVRPDVLNQALYHLWRRGVLSMSLNQTFASQVTAYRGTQDRLFQVFQILLKAENIIKVLAPGANQIKYGPGANDVILANDDIEFRLIPNLPLSTQGSNLANSKTLSDGNAGRKYPLLEAQFPQLVIEIWGSRTIPSPANYKMATLKIQLRSRAAFNATFFDNTILNGGNNDFRMVNSIQVNICDDLEAGLAIPVTEIPSPFNCDYMRNSNVASPVGQDLYYTLEVMDGPTNNPLNLDPNGIFQVFDPTVKNLIVPVVNYILEFLPLERKDNALSLSAKNDPEAAITGRTQTVSTGGQWITVNSTTGLRVGMALRANNFPEGTLIMAISGSTNIFVSRPSTANVSSAAITFFRNKIMANCGVRLGLNSPTVDTDGLQVWPIPDSVNDGGNNNQTTPYFLLRVPLSSYTFSGDCAL